MISEHELKILRDNIFSLFLEIAEVSPQGIKMNDFDDFKSVDF